MRPADFVMPHLETSISFPGIEVKLDEIEVNILTFDGQPDLPRTGKNYVWHWHWSISTDRANEEEEEEYDTLVCYINGDLMMKGHKYDIIKINTLHTYRVSKLDYKKAHEEIYKAIARESRIHANAIIEAGAKGGPHSGFPMPEQEDWLDEEASEWNKRGYLPPASKPDDKALGRKLTKKEINQMTARANELVKWIDDYADRNGVPDIMHDKEYWDKYLEWHKLNQTLWHFKHIARNTIAYILIKMLSAMEKAMENDPDNEMLQQHHRETAESYRLFIEAHKDDFAKN